MNEGKSKIITTNIYNSSTSMVLAGSGNGNGNGKDKKDEDWLTPVLMNWLPEIGIDLTDINSIVARASPRLIEDSSIIGSTNR